MRAEFAAFYVGMSRSIFDAKVSAGELPKPIPTVGNLKVWYREDLDAWLDEQRAKATSSDGNEWDDFGGPR